jgi:uncharacterized membrane protein YfcA
MTAGFMSAVFLSMIRLYLMVGAVSGVLAGLLGIGGGLVTVPMLLFCFTRQGIGDADIMHTAWVRPLTQPDF